MDVSGHNKPSVQRTTGRSPCKCGHDPRARAVTSLARGAECAWSVDRQGHSDTGVMHASTGLEVRKKPAHVAMGEGPGDSLWSDATVGCWQARAMNQHGHEGRDAQQSKL
jgi:hypothetical protein